MKVQLCWKKKGDHRLYRFDWMNSKEAKEMFIKMDTNEITFAYLRRWEGYGYVCHKVLKDNKERGKS